MKKILVAFLGIVLSTLMAYSSEIEDDYIDIASNYCVVGDYSNAMIYLDKILVKNPNNKQALYLKHGLERFVSGEKRTFLSVMSPIVKDALEIEKKGDSKTEISVLNSALQDKNSYLAYYYLGDLYRENKKYTKAIESYHSAITARPDFAQCYLALAITMFEMGSYKSVMDYVDKYLSFLPQDDFAYALKSRAEFELGIINLAKLDNEKAISINNCPEYLFDKAKILYKMEKYSEAKDLFNSLLQDIQTSKIYEYLGLCDIELKNYSSALLNIDRAIILSNGDSYLEEKYDEIKKKME